jgi:antitoxin VapB
MPLSIRNPKVETLARDVARRTGETVTKAIERALEQRLAGLRTDREKAARRRKIERIVRKISRMPDRDTRSADEILGYDERGLPR